MKYKLTRTISLLLIASFLCPPVAGAWPGHATLRPVAAGERSGLEIGDEKISIVALNSELVQQYCVQIVEIRNLIPGRRWTTETLFQRWEEYAQPYGFILMNENGEVVGFIFAYERDCIKKDKSPQLPRELIEEPPTNLYIDSLAVAENEIYRRKGLAQQLILRALTSYLGAKKGIDLDKLFISVQGNQANIPACKLYGEKLGFNIIGTKSYPDYKPSLDYKGTWRDNVYLITADLLLKRLNAQNGPILERESQSLMSSVLRPMAVREKDTTGGAITKGFNKYQTEVIFDALKKARFVTIIPRQTAQDEFAEEFDILSRALSAERLERLKKDDRGWRFMYSFLDRVKVPVSQKHVVTRLIMPTIKRALYNLLDPESDKQLALFPELIVDADRYILGHSDGRLLLYGSYMMKVLSDKKPLRAEYLFHEALCGILCKYFRHNKFSEPEKLGHTLARFIQMVLFPENYVNSSPWGADDETPGLTGHLTLEFRKFLKVCSEEYRRWALAFMSEALAAARRSLKDTRILDAVERTTSQAIEGSI